MIMLITCQSGNIDRETALSTGIYNYQLRLPGTPHYRGAVFQSLSVPGYMYMFVNLTHIVIIHISPRSVLCVHMLAK